MKLKLYGLQHKKYPDRLVGFETRANEGEFCSDVEYELCYYEDNPWITTDKNVAEKVANNTVKWYNSHYDSPINPYVGDLVIIEFNGDLK